MLVTGSASLTGSRTTLTGTGSRLAYNELTGLGHHPGAGFHRPRHRA